MRLMKYIWWKSWLLLGILASSHCQSSYSICDQHMCHCDGFGRVICECTHDYEEVTLESAGANKILPTATHIKVSNCQRVKFSSNALKNLQLLKFITISGVSSLTLPSEAIFYKGYIESDNLHHYVSIHPGISVVIENTTITDIQPFAVKGRIDDIFINGSTIQNIHQYAFSNLIMTSRIKILDSFVHSVEMQAFKKFSVGTVEIMNTKIKSLQSRGLSDLKVVDALILRNVTVDKLKSSAFIVTGVKKFQVIDCIFNQVEGDSFRVITKNSVLFQNNTFGVLMSGAFAGIGVEKEITDAYGLKEFNFENNTVEVFEKDSLSINENNFEWKMRNLMINKKCDCERWKQWSFISTHEDSILCIEHENYKDNYVFLKDFERRGCTYEVISLAILLPLIFGIIIAILAVILGVLCFCKNRMFKNVAWINGKKSKELEVIMPEGKTYRETELHVIVEKGEFLTSDL